MTDPDVAPRHADDVIYRIVDDEAILLNLDSGYYYSLDPLGSEIWSLCDGCRSLDAIVDRICADYDVNRARAQGDLQELLGDLTREGLLTIDDPEI